MNNKRLAKNIKDARLKTGITQKALSEKIGVSLVTMQKYEDGARRPLLEGIEALAKVFGINPISLLNGVFDD